MAPVSSIAHQLKPFSASGVRFSNVFKVVGTPPQYRNAQVMTYTKRESSHQNDFIIEVSNNETRTQEVGAATS